MFAGATHIEAQVRFATLVLLSGSHFYYDSSKPLPYPIPSDMTSHIEIVLRKAGGATLLNRKRMALRLAIVRSLTGLGLFLPLAPILKR